MSEGRDLRIELGEQLAKEIDYGVFSTFSSMFGINPKAGAYRIEKDCAVQGDVSGILSMTQDKVDGILIISFPKATIFGMLSKIYKKPITEINQTVKLGVGELTNIIYGVVKSNLNKKGFCFKKAIPHVVIGDQHSVLTCDSDSNMVVPFSTEFGIFYVLLNFCEQSGNEEAA